MNSKVTAFLSSMIYMSSVMTKNVSVETNKDQMSDNLDLERKRMNDEETA